MGLADEIINGTYQYSSQKKKKKKNVADEIINGNYQYKAEKTRQEQQVQEKQVVHQLLKGVGNNFNPIEKTGEVVSTALDKGNDLINYFASGKAQKDATQAAKNTGKFLTDMDYREKVGLDTLLSGANALNIAGKTVLSQVESGAKFLYNESTKATNWLNNQLGLMSDEQYQKAEQFRKDFMKENTTEKIWKDVFGWNDEVNNFVKKNSFITEDNFGGQTVQGLTQLMTTAAMGQTGFGWELPTFISSAGGAEQKAYQLGANDTQALAVGLFGGTLEVLTEKLGSGVVKVKGTGWKSFERLEDDLTNKITNNVTRYLAQTGVSAMNEGLEEVISGYGNAIAEKLTYMKDKDLKELYSSKDAFQDFMMATWTSLLAGGARAATPSGGQQLREDIRSGRSQITGFTQNEQKIIDSEVAQRIQEAKEKGQKVKTGEIVEQVQEDLRNGDLSVESIQRGINGEKYQIFNENETKLKETQSQLEEVEKNLKDNYSSKVSKLNPEYEQLLQQQKDLSEQINVLKNNQQALGRESYLEARELSQNDALAQRSLYEYEQGGRHFEYKLDDNASDRTKGLYESASQNGNNTTKFRNFVKGLDTLQNSTDKSYQYRFTNTEELREKGLLGKTNYEVQEGDTLESIAKKHNMSVEELQSMNKNLDLTPGNQIKVYAMSNGLKAGNTIYLNIDTNDSLETVLGHEVTHLLEGTDDYDTLQKLLYKQAKKQGIYDSKRAEVEELYAAENADIDSELTAELAKELFTDENFINELTTKPTTFKKVLNFIDDLITKFTGSSEEVELRKIKKQFQEAFNNMKSYDESNKVQHSLEEQTAPFNNAKQKQLEIIQENNPMDSSLGEHTWINNLEDIKTYQEALDYDEYESGNMTPDFTESMIKEALDKGEITVYSSYPIKQGIFVTPSKMEAQSYAGDGKVYSKTVKLNEVAWIDSLQGQYANVDNDIAPTNAQYSISKQDNQGRELSERQQEYFRDSKVRDNEGRLLEVYHGTPNPGFTIFDPNRASSNTSSGEYGLYFTDSKQFADDFSYERLESDSMFYDKKGKKGDVYSNYLNITNPLDFANLTQEQIEDLYNYASNMGQLDGKDAFVKNMLRWQEIGNHQLMKGNLDLKAIADNSPYDGIKAKLSVQGNENEYIVFNPNQVKNVDNTNPTSNPDIRYSLSVKEANTTEDNKGRKLSPGIIERNQNSRAVDENGKLITVYHTTTDYTSQFNEFNPVGTPGYKYGDVAVNFYTDSQDMSSSYGNNAIAPDTTRVKSMKDVNKQLGDRYTLVERNGKYEVYDKYDEIQLNNYKELINIFNEQERNILNETFNKSRGEVLDMYDEATFDKYDLTRKKFLDMLNVLNDTKGVTKVDKPRLADEIIRNYLDNNEIQPVRTFNNKEDLYRNLIQVTSPNSHYQYEGYLNMTNPYIVDGRNKNWNNITRGISAKNEEIYNSLTQKEKDYLSDLADKMDNMYDNHADSVEGFYQRLNANNEKLYDKTTSESSIREKLYDAALYQWNNTYVEDLIGERETTNEIVKEVLELNKNGANYDGVIFEGITDYGFYSNDKDGTPHNVYVTFNSNQFKAYDNTNPTDDPDIRYSMSNDIAPTRQRGLTYDVGVRQEQSPELIDIAPINERIDKARQLRLDYDSEVKALEELDNTIGLDKADSDRLEYLKSLTQTTNESTGQEYTNEYSPFEKAKKNLAENKVKRFIEKETYKAIDKAAKVAAQYGEFNRKEKTNLRNEFKRFGNLTSEQLTNPNTYNEFKDIIRQYADREMNFTDYHLKEVRDDIRKRKINVSDIRNQITDFNDYRRQYFGRLNLTNEGMTIDQHYQELSELYPEYFSKDITTEADMLNQLMDFMDLDTTITEKYRLSDDEIDRITSKAFSTLVTESPTEQQIQEYEEEINRSVERKRSEVRRQQLLDEMGLTIDDISVGKDINALGYQRTDPIRLNEKVFGYEVGKKINDATIRQTIHNTAEKMRWQNQERSEIEDLGIKARSKESAAVQKYGEGEYVNDLGELVKYGDKELASEFPNIETQNKIKRAAEVLRGKYDTYIDQINDVLTDLGYDAIPKRKNYFRHFIELNDKFSQWGTPFNRQTMQEQDLPTDINGLTDQFKPGKQYFASALERKGIKTTYDAITGIDGYIETAGNLIFHTEDIQRYRALSKLIRETYGQTHGFDNIDIMTEAEKNQRVEDVYGNKLTKYAAWLDEQANALAGKKAGIDRAVERMLGRKVYTAASTLKSQVGSNMTGFNVRSAMTNFASVVQGASKTSKIALLKGTISTIQNMIHDDGMTQKSDFLTGRYGTNQLSQKAWQKIANAGQIFMEASDHFTSNQIWRSKYYELLDRGMSETEAIREADDFAARVMGNRVQGATAEIFNSKTLGFLTQFQLEVNNQWSNMIHDNKMDIQSGKKGAASVVFQLGQLYGLSYMFNTIMKGLTGSDVMFDPIDLLMKLFNPDDDDKTTEERARDVLGDIVNQLPMASIFTGGRIPIQEAFSGVSTGFKYLTGQENEYGQKYTAGDVFDDSLESLAYLLLPTGYGQLRKTYKGTIDTDYDVNLNPFEGEIGITKRPVRGSYTDSGNLRFTADNDIPGRIRSALFGQYANSEAQDYIDSEYQTINAKKIPELQEFGMTSSEYKKWQKEYAEATSTTEEIDGVKYTKYKDSDGNIYLYDKNTRTLLDSNGNESNKNVTTMSKVDKKELVYDYIKNSDFTPEQKEYLFDENFDNTTTDKYGYGKYTERTTDKKGKPVTKTYWYDSDTNTLYDSKYKVSNKDINSLTKVSSDKSVEGYNSFDTYEEFDYSYKNPDKYKLIQDTGSYKKYKTNETYKNAVDWAYNTPSNYSISKALDGIENTYTYLDKLNDIKGDKDRKGKTISGSRKKKVFNYINSLNLTPVQKAMLVRTQYSSYDNYNNEIVNYLNNQTSITLDEEYEILKKLGYTIKGDRVSW